MEGRLSFFFFWLSAIQSRLVALQARWFPPGEAAIIVADRYQKTLKQLFTFSHLFYGLTRFLTLFTSEKYNIS